jgi:hypothetical protein
MNPKTIVSFMLCVCLCGCLPLIIGGAALGGYAISQDTMQGETDYPVETVWKAACAVAQEMGMIRVQEQSKGSLAFTIRSNNVNIKISEVTLQTTRLRVSCRNQYLMPSITLAQKVFIRIMEKANKK